MVWSVLCNSKYSCWVESLRFSVRQESEGTKSTILAQSENLQLENDTLSKIDMQNIIVKDKHKKCAWSIFKDLLFLIRSASLNFLIKKVCYLFDIYCNLYSSFLLPFQLQMKQTFSFLSGCHRSPSNQSLSTGKRMLGAIFDVGDMQTILVAVPRWSQLQFLYCYYVGEFNRAWRGFTEANLCYVSRVKSVANRAFTHEMKKHFTGK